MLDLEYYNISKDKINQFNTAGIFTDLDLLKYVPKNYKDYGLPVTNFSNIKKDGVYNVCGRVRYVNDHGKCFSVTIYDKNNNKLRLLSFNKYIEREFSIGSVMLISCSLTYNEQYCSYSGTIDAYYDYDPR